MLVTTHTVVASTVAITTGNPWIYIPAAIVNHLILDILPHAGFDIENDKQFKKLMLLDAAGSLFFFLLFILTTDVPPLTLVIVNILAGWPDLTLGYRALINKGAFERFDKFHKKIHGHESGMGIFIEIGIIAVCLYAIYFS